MKLKIFKIDWWNSFILNYQFQYTAKAGNAFCCRELLVDFYKTSNGRKPTQIIVFRYHDIVLVIFWLFWYLKKKPEYSPKLTVCFVISCGRCKYRVKLNPQREMYPFCCLLVVVSYFIYYSYWRIYLAYLCCPILPFYA